MRLLKHEMRQGILSLAIWTGSIAFLMVICIVMFPEMKGQMEDVSDMFASMGSFTAAFGMDRLSFGTLTGFYAIECGNILGLGGAFYAALTGITALAKEEKEHTAEFLLTHPVTRTGIVSAKLASVLFQITVMNVLILAISLISILFIDEEIPWKELLLFHLAYYLHHPRVGRVFEIQHAVRLCRRGRHCHRGSPERTDGGSGREPGSDRHSGSLLEI